MATVDAMKWQDKIRSFCRTHPMSMRELASRSGITGPTLGAALDSSDSWGTVQTAIQIARTMGTTVEYLFDPDTPWPMAGEDRPRLATKQEVLEAVSMAIASLERMGAAEELAKLTSELLRRGADEPGATE